MMALQTDCLSTLDAKLGLVKFQLRLVKETHATVELNKLRAPVLQPDAKPVVEVTLLQCVFYVEVRDSP